MWHVDGKYYAGVIKDVLRVGKRLFHDVSYDKGDLEFFLDLKVRKWRYQNPDSEGDGEEESESATASKRTKSTSKGKKTSSRRTSRQRPASDEVLSGGSPSPLLRRVGRGDAPLFGGSTQKARGKPRKSLPPRFADDPRARESSFSPPLSPLGVPSLDTPPSLESPVLPILSRSPSVGRGDGMGSGTGRLPDPGDFDKDILNLIVDEVDVPLPDLFELPRKRSRGQDIDAITANLVERKKQKAAELPGVEMDLIQTPPGKRSSSSIAKEDGDAIAPGDSGTGKLHSTELEDTEVINLQSPDEQKRMAGEDGNRPDTDADRSPKSKEDSRPPETRQLAVRQPGGVVPVSGPAPDGRRLAVRKPDTRQLAVRQPETRQLAVRRPEDRVLAVRQQPSRQLAVRNDSAPSNMVDSRHSAGSLTREVPVSRRRSLDVEYIDDRRRPKTRVSDIVSVAGLVARKWASEEVAVLMRRIQTSRKQVHNIRKYQAAAEKTLRKRVKQIERIEQEEEERTRDLPKTAQNADAYLDLEAHLGSFKEDLVDQVKRYRRTVEERERSLKRQFAVIKDEMAVQNTELLETAKTIRALDHDAIPALSRLEPRLKKVVPESARSEVLSSPSGLMRTFPTIGYMESEAARGLQQKVSDLSRKSDLLSAEVKRLQEREKQLSNEKERALVELTKSRYGMSGVASPPRKPVPTAPRRDVGITPSAPVSKGSRTLRTPARPVRPAPVKPLGLVKKRVGVPKGGVSKDGLRHSGKANRKTLPRTSGKYKPPPPLPATPLVPKTPTRAAPVAKGQVVVPSPSAPIPVKVFPAQLGKQMDKQAAELLALITTVWLLQDEGRSEPPRKPGEKQDQWVEGCVKGALRHAVTYLTTCSGIMSAKKTLLQEVDGEAVKTTWISAENDAGIEAARTNYKLWEPTLAQEEWIVEKRVLCGLNVSIRTAMKATAAAQFSATIMYAKEIGRRALVDFDVVMGPSLHRKVGDTGNVASLAGAQTQPASDMAAALNPMSSLTYTPVRTTDRTSTPDSSTKATATRGSAPGSQATAPIPRLPESARRTKGKAPNPVVPTATPILPAPTQVPRPQSAAGAKASLPSKPPTTSPSQLTSTTPAAGGRTIVPKTSPAQNQGAAVPAGPSAMKAEKITSQSKAADAPTPDKMKGVQTATAGVPSPEKAAVGAGASINARKSATDDAAGVQRGQVQSASSAGKGASAGAALEAVKGTDLVSDASGSASRPAPNAVAKTSAPAGQVQPEKPKGPTGSDSRGSTILPAAPSSEMVPIPAQKPDVIEKTLVKPATEGSGAPGKKKASSQSGGQAGTKKSGGTAKSRSAGSRKSTKAGSASKAQPSSLKAAAGRDQATQQPAVASAVLGQQGSAEELPNTGSNRVYKARGKLSAQVTTSQIKAPPGTAQMRLPPVPTRRTAPSMRQDISVGAGDHSDPLLPGGGMSASGVPGVQGMDASDGSSLKARDVGIPRVGGKMPSAKPPKQGSGQKEGRASGNDRGATLLRGTPSSAAKGRKGSQNTLFQSTPRKQVGFKSIPQPGKRRSGLSNPSSPFDARVQAAYTPSFDSVPASQVTQPSQHQEEYRRPATSQELHTALGTGGAHEAYRERVDGGSGGMFPSGEGAYGTYGAAMHERGNELGHMDLMNPATPSAFPGLDGYMMNDSAVGLKRLPNEERESLPATPSDFPPDRVFPGALNSPINFERNYVTPENFGASRNPYGAGASFGPGGGGPGGGGPGGGGASGLGHLMNPQQQQQQGQAYRGQQFQHRAPFQRGGPR
ncbi:unnamed protein product [Chondrus crispus]|uniref:Uncharacterized protein n=1 Tax=Chondrus crispus TaxID=2769 RepID=R7QFU8_CHOCR|nr:unnamed protein product [Chondrus crispus]CDF37397.1 unnamed protein product [Chondrus crispus]|eukprot:XP_005717216.1 unnamed protein product [Chondrus crispus]